MGTNHPAAGQANDHGQGGDATTPSAFYVVWRASTYAVVESRELEAMEAADPTLQRIGTPFKTRRDADIFCEKFGGL